MNAIQYNSKTSSKLKKLKLAHDIAENYDYIPSNLRTKDIMNFLLIEDYEIVFSICSEYEGFSDGDILLIIKKTIEEL